MVQLANRIINLLEALVFGTVTVTRAGRFTQDRDFDFSKMGTHGIRNFTIRNLGRHRLIIEDNEEVLNSGDSFTISSPHLLADESFKVRFGELDPNADTTITALKDASVRYLVDKC